MPSHKMDGVLQQRTPKDTNHESGRSQPQVQAGNADREKPTETDHNRLRLHPYAPECTCTHQLRMPLRRCQFKLPRCCADHNSPRNSHLATRKTGHRKLATENMMQLQGCEAGAEKTLPHFLPHSLPLHNYSSSGNVHQANRELPRQPSTKLQMMPTIGGATKPASSGPDSQSSTRQCQVAKLPLLILATDPATNQHKSMCKSVPQNEVSIC